MKVGGDDTILADSRNDEAGRALVMRRQPVPEPFALDFNPVGQDPASATAVELSRREQPLICHQQIAATRCHTQRQGPPQQHAQTLSSTRTNSSTRNHIDQNQIQRHPPCAVTKIQAQASHLDRDDRVDLNQVRHRRLTAGSESGRRLTAGFRIGIRRIIVA